MVRRPRKFVVRRYRALITALALAPLLCGCVMQRQDALAPIITITEPRSGATRSAEVLDIYGYAYDDSGVAAIRVNGTDLLQFEDNRVARGTSLIQFAFRGSPDREGDVEFMIEVEDVSGRVTVLPYTLSIDSTPPTLELEAEALGNGRYRLNGVARDNTLVSTIRLGGQPLQFVPASEYSFRFGNIQLSEPLIEVVDAAGNTISQRFP